jgi:hypothetical protein
MKRILTLLIAIIISISTCSCAGAGVTKDPYRPTYRFDTVVLEGIDIEDYTIAISRGAYKKAATSLADALARYNGHTLPIKTIDQLTDKDKKIILIGASSLDGSEKVNYGLFGYGIAFHEGERVAITVDFSSASVLDSAIKTLLSLFDVASDKRNAEITLKNKEYLGFFFQNDPSPWALIEEETSEIYDGVTYTYQLFKNSEGLPYRAHVLKIDPSKAYLYTGTSNDGYDYTVDTPDRQNVKKHIEAAKSNGITPIAAVNGDFFNISGDYHPLGLCIKEGTVISEVGSRPWAGYTYDGQFVCGSASLYKEYEGKLRTAVGASNVLVSEGAMLTNGTEGIHPRTLAGVTADGTIILAVIDGRQPSVSNGASFARCAMFMVTHGAYYAVNLDGGGSSTCITLSDGVYKTMNSPSDGGLRKVYNSLLVVPKDK